MSQKLKLTAEVARTIKGNTNLPQGMKNDQSNFRFLIVKNEDGNRRIGAFLVDADFEKN